MQSNRRSFLRVLGIGSATAAVVAPAAVMAAKAAPDASFDLARDPFHIPPALIPPGVKYQWKRIFVDAQTPDLDHLATMLNLGWQPVPFARHADHFKHRGHHSWIEVGGLVLMEKPLNKDPAIERGLVEKARAYDIARLRRA